MKTIFSRRRSPVPFIALAIFLPALVSLAEDTGTAFHVGVDGEQGNQGTQESPWDIESAWSGQQKIPPGSTLFLKGGVYRHADRSWGGRGFDIALQGTSERPIRIRPMPGERVTLDGSVEVKPNAEFIEVWDLELTVSETAGWSRRVTPGGDKPAEDVTLPRGGLNIIGGTGSKFINLVIHNTASGVGFWRTASDAEMHGCLVYDNGSIGPDRYHGPGIYTQNEVGNKWLTDNILFGNYSTTIQAYGSDKSWVDGFRIVGNISFGPVKEGGRAQFLVGGGRPSRDIVVSGNLLYEVPLQIGYTAPHNEDLVAHDNLIVNAGFSINNYRKVDEDNNIVINAGSPRPERASDVFLRPNKYDPNRANLAVFNWKREPSVRVSLAPFVAQGQRFRIVSALDFFGEAVAAGTFDGEPVEIPITAEERTGQGEFCAFVVFRSSAPAISSPQPPPPSIP